jgi:uncharacterized protein (TIGR03000 family)
MRSLLCSVLLLAVGAQTLFAAPPANTPSAGRNSATIRVTLPANAQLTVDGYLTHSTSVQRLLESPPLEPGKVYRYNLKAEFEQGGKTITVQQPILVRAGRETDVSLNVPGSSAYESGAGSPETSAFYLEPEAPPPAAPAPQYFRPVVAPPAPIEASPSPFIHWGKDQSDPFYYNEPNEG